jgi:protein-export membrane protein SecD
MWKVRIIALVLLLAGASIGYFNYTTEINKNSRFPIKLGLDLSGGSHLVYRADTSALKTGEIKDSMSALRDVIERRVNMFGVSEPVVQVEETSGFISDGRDDRLIVELPGVTDIDQAISMIGQTPLLEFMKEKSQEEKDIFNKTLEEFKALQSEGKTEKDLTPQQIQILSSGLYQPTELTGRFLERASLEFDNNSNTPIVSLVFDKEGSKLFAKITKENIGKTIAIYLDGASISNPVVQEEITGGRAQISGSMNPEEAKTLVGRLNSGALPIPISLLSTQTIGPSLGKEVFDKGVRSGVYGILLVMIFLIFWYRLPGLLASFSLLIYIAIMIALFKLIPVTLTAAGIAGFILSIGMAVDANVLIFERMKEELRSRFRSHDTEEGESEVVDIREAIHIGFTRAWLSIRDGNISSLLTAIILFWFGTSLVKGFALTFGIGVLVSMVSAISITRTFLFAVSVNKNKGIAKFLFGTGLGNQRAKRL